MVVRRTMTRLGAVAVIAAVMVFASVGLACATPTDQTLGLDALQAKLTAVYPAPIAGYMKTVVKGSTIVTIPVAVEAISGDDPNTDLILFEATGTLIAKYGGIVEGMSGSPVYIEDGGVDKVIGAVSYGDIFTLGGSGLATPIEQMIRISTDYMQPTTQDLSAPVLMNGRLINKVVVPTNPKAYKSAAMAPGTFVGKPLSSVYIGCGLKLNSPFYANLKRRMAAENPNLSVVTLDAPLSAGKSDFTTDLVPGSSIAALMTRGDLWLGGLGTTTYTDPDTGTVLAFGHPFDWDGPTSLYMTNAWVDGVWPSSYVPYKTGYPTAIRGEFTQDRSDGIAGLVSTATPVALPLETKVTAEVTDGDKPGHETSTTTYFTSKLFDSGVTSFYASYAASIAAYDLYDQSAADGSALTTTTVVVSDGTKTYTVSMPDIVSSSYDIASAVSVDVMDAVFGLQSVLDYGLQQPHIVSIDLQAQIQRKQRSAEIVGVKPESPLKVGANRVDVSLLAYGVEPTQTVVATVTIPAGTPVSGVLSASSLYFSDGGDASDIIYGEDGSDDESDLPDEDVYTRETVAQTVDDLNAEPPQSTVIVSFYPESNADLNDDDESDASDTATQSIDATVATAWVPDGSVHTLATELTAETESIAYGDDAFVDGEIFGPEAPVKVSVYGTPAGSTTETLLAHEMSDVDPDDGSMTYEVDVPELYTNTLLRVHIDGGSGYTAADTFITQKVKAYVRVSASSKSFKHGKNVTLTGLVAPGSTVGSVTFQYSKSGGSWHTIVKRTVAAGSSYARATYSWKPGKGSYKVRAFYGGGILNAAAYSSTMKIQVK